MLFQFVVFTTPSTPSNTSLPQSRESFQRPKMRLHVRVDWIDGRTDRAIPHRPLKKRARPRLAPNRHDEVLESKLSNQAATVSFARDAVDGAVETAIIRPPLQPPISHLPPVHFS